MWSTGSLAAKVQRIDHYTANMSSVAPGSFYDPLVGIGRAEMDVQAQSERRKNLRLPLQWSVHVVRLGARRPLRSKTRNLSSRGFYCVLHERLTTGERIECDLVVPTHTSRSCDDVLFLRCQARVVRVERVDAGEEYGLACRIEDYYLIHGTPRETPDEPPWTGAEPA